MEENKMTSQTEGNLGGEIGIKNKFSNVSARNIKPFLSVFIILLIIILGYYFLWRSVAVKMKNVITSYISDYQYDSIEISGFPFSKEVIINNVTISNNNVLLISQNQVNIKQVKVSSFILSNNLDIKVKDASIITVPDNNLYSLIYNEEPIINVGFYSNGELKSVKYLDYGYRVVNNNNETLYTADRSELNVDSVMDNNKLDYSITGSLQNIKNLSIMKTDNQISEVEIPDSYGLDFDISSSMTSKDGEIESSIIKINNFNLRNGNDNFSASGEILSDITDPYSFGNIKFVLTNYVKILNSYKSSVREALNIEFSKMSKEERDEYIRISDQIFTTLNNLIKKNPETKGNVGVMDIKRTKGNQDYIINGESLIGIIQKILSSNK